MYDVLNIYLEDSIKALTYQKRIRPSEEQIVEFYQKVETFWNELVIGYKPLQELQDSQPSDKIAALYRNRNGGHLLFRPIGLKMVVRVIKYLMNDRLSLQKAVQATSRAKMNINEDPW